MTEQVGDHHVVGELLPLDTAQVFGSDPTLVWARVHIDEEVRVRHDQLGVVIAPTADESPDSLSALLEPGLDALHL